MDIVQRIFKSLAGKTRLDILLLLLEKGELTINEIASTLHRQVSTISRNLRILEKDNFVKAPPYFKECLLLDKERRKIQIQP
jgi:predicted transcriptional regulator